METGLIQKNNRQVILIYAGPGVAQNTSVVVENALNRGLRLGEYSVFHVRPQTIIIGGWEELTAVFIVPGGRDVKYHEELAGIGNERIRNFVANGGVYLGICAGAYYGATRVEFEKGRRNAVCKDRELGFFPGTAWGPAYGHGHFRYEHPDSSRIVPIEWLKGSHEDNLFSSYYFGGGCFLEPEKYENVEVLARYPELPSQPAAIIRCKVGNGQAVLCSPHPEYSATDLRNYAESHHGHTECYKPLIDELTRFEQSRCRLWTNVLEAAGLNVIKR